MMLPLYKSLKDDFANIDKKTAYPHTGLLFDKYPDRWSYDERTNRCTIGDDKKKFYKQIATDLINTSSLINKSLKETKARRKALLDASGGQPFVIKTTWRFVSGLGMGHPYEAGFIWHRTLGVPYLPGSSIKGMMRAWAEQWADPKVDVKDLLGDTEKQIPGCLIIFDALPTACPTLELDIMNPHYAPYYEHPHDPNYPPADYYSPRPIYFLAVAANQEFEFAIAHRKPKEINSDEEVKRGIALLEKALSTIGAGGKTAVGYGQFGSTSIANSNNTAIPESKTVDFENTTLILKPGSGELSANIEVEGKSVTAHASGEEAKKMRLSLSETLSKRLKKKKSLGGLKLTVEINGNTYKIVDIGKTDQSAGTTSDRAVNFGNYRY